MAIFALLTNSSWRTFLTNQNYQFCCIWQLFRDKTHVLGVLPSLAVSRALFRKCSFHSPKTNLIGSPQRPGQICLPANVVTVFAHYRAQSCMLDAELTTTIYNPFRTQTFLPGFRQADVKHNHSIICLRDYLLFYFLSLFFVFTWRGPGSEGSKIKSVPRLIIIN